MWAKTIVASARELMIMAMLIGASCRLFAGSGISRPFVFGMNTGSTVKECELAKSAGCTCMRIGCGWDLVEKTHGAYDFSEPDAAVARCVKYGFEPFFLVVATPPFYLLSGGAYRTLNATPAQPLYAESRVYSKQLLHRQWAQPLVKRTMLWHSESETNKRRRVHRTLGETASNAQTTAGSSRHRVERGLVMSKRVFGVLMAVCLVCMAVPSIAGGHWALAFWRCLGQNEAADNLFVRFWTFDENGFPKGGITIGTPYGTVKTSTETNGYGRVDMAMGTGAEYVATVSQSGATSDVTPYMSTGRYPNFGHYSYEVGFMYKSDINNAGTFDTTIVGGAVPRLGGTSSNAPCTASLAYYSLNPYVWSSDSSGYNLPAWGEHGQTFVANGNRVACAEFHPTVGGNNIVLPFTVEIRQGGPTGAVIASKTSGNHYNQDWWIVPFGTSACPVVSGQTYFARVYNPAGTGFNEYYSIANNYTNGQAYWRANSSGTWAATADPDLKGFIVCCNVPLGVSVTNVATSPSTGSAVITWTTGVAASSRVDYGLTSAYGKTVSDSALVTSHSMTLTGLHGGSSYHFKITSSRSGYTDGVSADTVFTTTSTNTNLLVNGGFETSCVTGLLSPWVKFGVFSNNAAEPYGSQGIGPWCTAKCPPEGSCDIVSLVSWGTKNGGVYQVVSGVAPGAGYTAAMTYYTWQQGGSDTDCADQIGIDPTGGTNPTAGSVVWSPELSSQDTWSQASISATAQSGTITVFLRAVQKKVLEWNQNGFDNIKLTGPSAGSIPVIKSLVDGTMAAVSAKVVTATAGQVGAYYVQEPDRQNGLRVEAATGSASIGNTVHVSGWLTTVNGERIITDAAITYAGSATAKPLALNNRSLGGSDFNDKAKGATGKVGLNNVGLLVKTFGKVSSPASGIFYVTDGSGASVKVDASAVGTLPAANDYVVVTGISRLEKIGANYVPFVKLRQSGDWVKVN